jgi:2-methylcitrate dehydratase PrpD
VDYPKGDPENPLSADELRAKLAGLAPRADPAARDRLAALVLDEPLDVPASRLAEAVAAALA